MATGKTASALGPIRTLFGLGRVGDRSDGELLEWFETHREAAEGAFEEPVARHGGMVLDVCRRVLRDPNDVDDAFQATFLVLIRRAGSVRNREALGGWLHRVALRVALHAKRAAARRSEVEQKAGPRETLESASGEFERANAHRAIHEELDRLPASYRAALVACYLEGLTHEQAALRLRWPVGTVRSRLARGRDRLRGRLARRGLEPGAAFPAFGKVPELVAPALQKRAAHTMLSSIAGQPAAEKLSAPAALAGRVIRTMNLRILRICAALMLSACALAGTLPLWMMPAPRQASAAAEPPGDELDPAKMIVGVVRDKDGRPVEGATVVAGAFTEKPNHHVGKTSPDGRFRFQAKKGDRPLEYALAYKEGLAPASKLRAGSTRAAPTDDVELVLMPAEPVVGTVQDHAGKPIAGAKVRLAYMRGGGGKDDHNPILVNVLQGTPLESLLMTTTDKQGRFRFPAVPAPQRVVLRATAEGMADFSTEVPGDHKAGFISGTAAEPARLRMVPEARIVGRVVTKLPGVSVAGLKLGLQSTNDSAQFWRSVETDAAGRFDIRGLLEGSGNVFLMDHPNAGPWTYRAVDSLALQPGNKAEVTIELIPGVLVHGRVIDTVSGRPAVGAFVGMYGPARPRSGAAILSAKSDEKGEFRFRLPPGKTYLYVAGEPWAHTGIDVDVPDHEETFFAPDIETEPKQPGPPAGAVEIPRS